MVILSPPASGRSVLRPPTPLGTSVGTSHVPASRTPASIRANRFPTTLIGLAMAVLVLLQVGAMGAIDPVSTTVSDLVYAPGGHLLFPMMGVLCVAGSIVMTARLLRRRWWPAAGAMIMWCLALSLASFFPTDPPGVTTLSMSAEIHRYAAAAMFVAIPLAGFFTARAVRGADDDLGRAPRLTRASVLCALTGIGQFATSIPSLMPDSELATWPGVDALFAMRGLAERLLFVTMIVVLLRIARAVPIRPASTLPPIFHGDYRGNNQASTRGAAVWHPTRSTPPVPPREATHHRTRSQWPTDPSRPSPATGFSRGSENASSARVGCA